MGQKRLIPVTGQSRRNVFPNMPNMKVDMRKVHPATEALDYSLGVFRVPARSIEGMDHGSSICAPFFVLNPLLTC